MRLVETHHIKQGHSAFKECDELCRKSKLLYNEANYIVRQSFIKEHKYISCVKIKKSIQKTSENYKSLPAKVSSETLRLLHQNWLSFFKAIKDWKRNPEKYNGRPSLPGYKKVYFPTIYDRQAISYKFLKNNMVCLSQTNIGIPLQNKDCEVKQARIIPINSQLFKIEIVYKKGETNYALNKNKYLGIDLGIDNLCAVVGTNIKPFVITGKPLKSFNQYYNKQHAKLQSKLLKNQYHSKRLDRLSNKRSNKINDYFHKVSRMLINYCIKNDIGNVVIGYNPGWKQDVNLGQVNNQKFVSIPFYKFLQKLEYKAKLVGIETKIQEESYTSKCSWADDELIMKHDNYMGKRIKRGLFKTACGQLVNADINGAANILRKCNSQYNINIEGIEAISASPLRRNPYKQVL